MIIFALNKAKGDIAEASKELGMSRQTAYNWIREFKLWDYVDQERYNKKYNLDDEDESDSSGEQDSDEFSSDEISPEDEDFDDD
jgi:transposase